MNFLVTNKCTGLKSYYSLIIPGIFVIDITIEVHN